MNNQNENPWFVENLNEFKFFCCPECDERTQSKEIFLNHAVTEHPNSKEWLMKFQVKIEEIFQPIDKIVTECYVPMVKIEKSDINQTVTIARTFPILESKFDLLEPNLSYEEQDHNDLSEHFIDEKFKCTNCDKIFKNRKSLRRHFVVVHETNKNEKCDECGKTFRTKSNLRQHIQCVHKGMFIIRCTNYFLVIPVPPYCILWQICFVKMYT